MRDSETRQAGEEEVKPHCLVLAASLFLALFPLHAAAAASAYQCTMQVEPGRFVTQTYFVGLSADRRKAVVSDTLILRKHGKPVPARIMRNDDRIVRVTWRVKNLVSKRGESAKWMDFTLAIRLRKENSADIIVRIFDYPNSFSAKGSCVDVTGKTLPKGVKIP